MTVIEHTHTHTHRLVLENRGLFVCLFPHSVASITRACGGAVGFCAVNTLKIRRKFERELTVSVQPKMERANN